MGGHDVGGAGESCDQAPSARLGEDRETRLVEAGGLIMNSRKPFFRWGGREHSGKWEGLSVESVPCSLRKSRQQ